MQDEHEVAPREVACIIRYINASKTHLLQEVKGVYGDNKWLGRGWRHESYPPRHGDRRHQLKTNNPEQKKNAGRKCDTDIETSIL